MAELAAANVLAVLRGDEPPTPVACVRGMLHRLHIEREV